MGKVRDGLEKNYPGLDDQVKGMIVEVDDLMTCGDCENRIDVPNDPANDYCQARGFKVKRSQHGLTYSTQSHHQSTSRGVA
ncbi:MAG: hypothetical protein ABFS02_07450 [Pseudomonadota bacterium]